EYAFRDSLKTVSTYHLPSPYSHSSSLPIFFLMLPRSPRSTLFPYTTLFRSDPEDFLVAQADVMEERDDREAPHVGHVLVVLDLRSEEHTSELQSRGHLVCRLLLEKKKRSGGMMRPPITSTTDSRLSTTTAHG